jgi:hypothetical protein
MMRWALLVAFTLPLGLPRTSQAANVQATFHVSPDGYDAGPGSESKPFASVEWARRQVRAVNQEMTGDIVVVLRGGTYKIIQPIVFEAADSGTGGHDVIYRAAANELPVISGGKRITGWHADSGKRWKAKTDLDDFRQLYVGGIRAIRARSGVLGAVTNPGLCEFLKNIGRGGGLPGAERVDNEAYRTSAVDMAKWLNKGDIEFCYSVVWGHTRCKVEHIERQGDHALVKMLQPYFLHARTKEGVQADLPAYIENALELLDEPGEWYLDRPAKTVYYLPRPGEDMSKVEVIAPAVEKLVELRGTRDAPVQRLRFENITFQHGSWLRPNKIGHCDVQANFVVDSDRKDSFTRKGSFVNVHNENLKSPANVVCHAAKSVRFERCNFCQLGGAGLDIEVGSQDNVVSGCRFFDISGSAIQIGDVLKDDHHPDDPRKIVRNNVVENCSIHDCAVEYMGGVGVFAGYSERTRIMHNEITRLPYSGISMGWGWGEEDAKGGAYQQPFLYDAPTPAKNNRIELNHIHRVMQVMQDGGGVYTLGNMPSTVIRGNHIHDNIGEPGGIYLDEGSGFIEVTRNLVYAVPKPMFCNNAAQDRRATCKEHDNVFGGDYMPENAAAGRIAKAAGLEPAYQDLIAPKASRR